VVGAPILLSLTIMSAEKTISPSWITPSPVFAYYESRPYPSKKLEKLRELAERKAKQKQLYKKSQTALVELSGGDDLFTKYGDIYHVSPITLKTIAKCESGFNPEATNGSYGGMYQFHPTTWSATRQQMGADPNSDSRFNGEEAIKTAAFKISQEGTGAWPVCGRV